MQRRNDESSDNTNPYWFPLRLGGVSGLGARISQAQATDSEEISKLLSDAKTTRCVRPTKRRMMDTFTRSNLSWDAYVVKLSVIKEHVNHLGKLHADLAAIRHTGSPWQQTAIDQMSPCCGRWRDTLPPRSITGTK